MYVRVRGKCASVLEPEGDAPFVQSHFSAYNHAAGNELVVSIYAEAPRSAKFVGLSMLKFEHYEV